MPIPSKSVIQSLYRYPVKGLSAEPLQQVALMAGLGFPLDRAYAITNGAWDFDAAAYTPQPKSQFLMLMTDEKLAALRTRLRESDGCLEIDPGDATLQVFNPNDALDRERLSAFISQYLGKPLAGPPQLVRADGVRFTDVSVVSPALMHAVSLINLASVRALEEKMSASLHPMRFRANIYFDGGTAWEEFDWLGKVIRIGEVRARVVMRTRRCAATNVNPVSAARDLGIPQALMRHLRHGDLGVYAEIIDGGTLRAGDPIMLEEA